MHPCWLPLSPLLTPKQPPAQHSRQPRIASSGYGNYNALWIPCYFILLMPPTAASIKCVVNKQSYGLRLSHQPSHPLPTYDTMKYTRGMLQFSRLTFSFFFRACLNFLPTRNSQCKWQGTKLWGRHKRKCESWHHSLDGEWPGRHTATYCLLQSIKVWNFFRK